jgi:Phosphotransferase enzyme family
MSNPFNEPALAAYLGRLHGAPVANVRVAPLGGGRQGEKGYGYGIPLRVDYQLDGLPRRGVIETVRPGPFGHEHMADRAQLMLSAHATFGRLPRHVASLDVGAVRGGELVALGDAEEFFSLAEFVEGHEYADDLIRISRVGEAAPEDFARADVLCDYLVQIHGVRRAEPELYVRRIRELVGHGECIFGVADSYPPGPFDQTVREIERRALDWRWKLRRRSERLVQVHGDFHPWNILFRLDTDFSVLDRSRGEWGEAADDVCCLTLNYVFFSLRRCGRLEGDLENLFRRFWDRYLERSGDNALPEVAAPFFAFRALVMANPVWYPALQPGLRERILDFALNVLAAPRFDPARVNAYCGT